MSVRHCLRVLGVVAAAATTTSPATGTTTPAVPRVVPDAAVATTRVAFPRPERLAGRIEFWKQIFTHYGTTQVVVHDAKYVEKVYSVLDLTGASKKRVAAATNAEKKRLRAILLRLDGSGGDGLEGEERRIFELFHDVEGHGRFRAAADRLRAQAGLREHFHEAIRVSRRYLPHMEEIFRAEGLPVELTRLPFIESCFNVKAYSWRGAAGIWQFMPRTGRLHGLRVDRLVDERRDPLRATRAAVKYLRTAYQELGVWPLAITSYNHGVKGIARGVRAGGRRGVVALVERYEGRGFGFAGRNFYVEFLAALEIERDAERYFGPVEVVPLPATEELLLARSIGLGDAARAAGVSREELLAQNPALGGSIVKGGASVPRGYRLRLPAGTRADVEVQLALLPAEPPVEAPAAAGPDEPGVHRVRSGETLWHIARRYGTSVDDLLDHNEIADARRVLPGRRLRIPGHEGAPRLATPAASPSESPEIVAALVDGAGDAAQEHRVRRGQTLSHIARRYDTSVEALLAHNGIRDARRVRAGQILRIPVRTGGAMLADAVAALLPAPSVAPSVAADVAVEEGAGSELPVGRGDAAAVASSGAPPAGVQDGYIHHLVQRGQTLSHIARQYGISVGALKQHNGIRDARRVRAGQVIKVPRAPAPQDPAADTGPEAARDDYVQHGVRHGQTFWQTAGQSGGRSVRVLQRHSGISDSRRPKPRQIIEIPTS